jgi:hypothetical protein
MKGFALAMVAAAAGLGLACRGGETRPAAEPVAERKSAEPAPTPKPVVIADGTALVFTLESTLSSDQSRPEDTVEARLAEPIRSGERTVVPEGSLLRGHVRVAQRSGKTKGLARLAVSFDRIVVRGKTYPIEASPIDVTAEKTTGRDAKIIGGAAAVGAIIGGIADGGGGAVKGGLIGGAAGGGAVLLTRGKEIELPAGSTHTVRLTRSVVLD